MENGLCCSVARFTHIGNKSLGFPPENYISELLNLKNARAKSAFRCSPKNQVYMSRGCNSSWDLMPFRAMGFNAVSFYVFWGIHEPKRGEISFEGFRDLQPFFDAAKKAGIYLIARPGFAFIVKHIGISSDFCVDHTSTRKQLQVAFLDGRPILQAYGEHPTRHMWTRTRTT